MKKIILGTIITLFFSNCDYKSIKGSGVIATETRTITTAVRIKSLGSFDVEITPSETTSLKVEGDDNLVKHIIAEKRDGILIIKMDDNINYSTKNKLTVYITTPKIEEVRCHQDYDSRDCERYFSLKHNPTF